MKAVKASLAKVKAVGHHEVRRKGPKAPACSDSAAACRGNYYGDKDVDLYYCCNLDYAVAEGYVVVFTASP